MIRGVAFASRRGPVALVEKRPPAFLTASPLEIRRRPRRRSETGHTDYVRVCGNDHLERPLGFASSRNDPNSPVMPLGSVKHRLDDLGVRFEHCRLQKQYLEKNRKNGAVD